MADKDVDEQFAAIMAHWDDVALGLDPSGDPHPDSGSDPTREPDPDGTGEADRDGRTGRADDPVARAPEIRRIRDVSDLPDLDESPPSEQAPAESAVPRDWTPAEGSDEGSEEDWDNDEDVDDSHYTPPPPAPLPSSEDKHFWLMIVAMVAGPLLFLYLLLFNRDGNGWWMLFALLVSIAGFVLLVLRQPIDRDEDDDGIRL
jgi:hypothetical protein